MTKSILSALLLLVAISSAHSLQCYSCDSSNNFFCDYGFVSFLMPSAQCEANSGSGILDAIASIVPMTCATIVGKDGEGKSYTARGCVTKGANIACSVISTTMKFAESKEIQDLKCSFCDTDNCNSASRLGGMTIVALVSACFLFLF